MSLLFASNEWMGFGRLNPASVINFVGSGGQFIRDTDYARAEMRFDGDFTGNETSVYIAVDDLTEVYLQFTYRGGSNTDGQYQLADSPLAYIEKGSIALCRIAVTDRVAQFQYWDGTSAYINIGDTFMVRDDDSAPEKITIHAKIDASEGIFALYREGELHASYEGDTTVGETTIDRVRISNFLINSAGHTNVVDMIVADEPCFAWKVATIAPSGAGTNTAGTGLYSDVNEINVSDETLVSLENNGDIRTHEYSDLSSAAAGNKIVGICHAFRATRDEAGPNNANSVLRIGGANYFGDNLPIISGINQYYQIWEANPADSEGFEAADINGLEAGERAVTV